MVSPIEVRIIVGLNRLTIEKQILIKSDNTNLFHFPKGKETNLANLTLG